MYAACFRLNWDTCFAGKFFPPNIFAVKVYELKIAKMSLFHGLMKKTESWPHKFQKKEWQILHDGAGLAQLV